MRRRFGRRCSWPPQSAASPLPFLVTGHAWQDGMRPSRGCASCLLRPPRREVENEAQQAGVALPLGGGGWVEGTWGPPAPQLGPPRLEHSLSPRTWQQQRQRGGASVPGPRYFFYHFLPCWRCCYVWPSEATVIVGSEDTTNSGEHGKQLIHTSSEPACSVSRPNVTMHSCRDT